MDRQFRVAVVGATGLVGETMVSVLEERNFPVATLLALASERSLGSSVSFRGRHVPVQPLEKFDFAQCDIALFSAGAAVSRAYAPQAVAAGCLVIDNTSEFRYREDVPLVVPEVNPQAHRQCGHARHHRQSQLLDHPADGGAQAAARCRRDRAHRRRDLPVSLRRRARGARGAGATVDRRC